MSKIKIYINIYNIYRLSFFLQKKRKTRVPTFLCRRSKRHKQVCHFTAALSALLVCAVRRSALRESVGERKSMCDVIDRLTASIWLNCWLIAARSFFFVTSHFFSSCTHTHTWDGTGWDGMGQDGMEWDGMNSRGDSHVLITYVVGCRITYRACVYTVRVCVCVCVYLLNCT